MLHSMTSTFPHWGPPAIHNELPMDWAVPIPDGGFKSLPDPSFCGGAYSKQCNDIAKSIDWEAIIPNQIAAKACINIAINVQFMKRTTVNVRTKEITYGITTRKLGAKNPFGFHSSI